MTAHGAALLQDPAQLEQLLSGSAASFPGKVKALLILLDKKAVTFLTNWSKDTRPNKGSYEQVREQVASKFEQAKLLNAAAAAWGLDAWAAALGLRAEAGATPAPAAEPKPPPGFPSLSRIGHLRPPSAQALPRLCRREPRRQAKPAGRRSQPLRSARRAGQRSGAGSRRIRVHPGGRAVGAGRGLSWFAEGWDLFKQSPLIWIVNFVVFIFVLDRASSSCR